MPDNPKIADYYEHRMVISKRRVIFASRLLTFATNQLDKLEASISAYFSLFVRPEADLHVLMLSVS